LRLDPGASPHLAALCTTSTVLDSLPACLVCPSVRRCWPPPRLFLYTHTRKNRPAAARPSEGHKGPVYNRLPTAACFFHRHCAASLCRSPRRGSNTFTTVTTKIITTRTWDYKTRCLVLGHCTFGVGQSGAAATLAAQQLAIDLVRNNFPSCRNTASAHCKDTPARGQEAA
jgi:hypothetical protein